MSGPASTPRVAVIGLGTRYRQDDAVGLLAVQRLRDMAGADVEVIEHEGDPLDLLPIWSGRALAIIIDALNLPEKVGRIYQFDADVDTPPNRESVVSSHGHSLWDAWELANLLDQRPRRAIVFAIAGRQFGQGEGLSPEVERAIDGVVGQVRDEIGRFVRSTAVDD